MFCRTWAACKHTNYPTETVDNRNRNLRFVGVKPWTETRLESSGQTQQAEVTCLNVGEFKMAVNTLKITKKRSNNSIFFIILPSTSQIKKQNLMFTFSTFIFLELTIEEKKWGNICSLQNKTPTVKFEFWFLVPLWSSFDRFSNSFLWSFSIF